MPHVIVRFLHILLVVSLFLQGGTLRACQLQDVLGVGDSCEGSSIGGSGTVPTLTAVVPSGHEGCHQSVGCTCEYLKTNGQSARGAAGGELHLFGTSAGDGLPVVMPIATEHPARAAALPEAPDARRSLPLLI